jgi:hypothetical protein
MPTDEFKPVLDRAQAIANAKPLIDRVCPLLREVVNHATWAVQRCHAASDAIGDENEDLAAFILYRHLIELTDSIEVLYASSCADAAVPLLRAHLEAAVSLEYILRDDYKRRSLAWVCGYQRIASHEMLDAKTASGARFATLHEQGLGTPPEAYDAGPPVAALRSVLAREQFRELEATYERLQREHRRPPDWFQLVGVRNRRVLAQAVDREFEYVTLYGFWSAYSHAADASRYLRPGRHPGETGFSSVRTPHAMAGHAVIPIGLMVNATRLMIDHFRAGESIAPWYAREIQRPFEELRRLRIVPKPPAG